MGIDLLDISFRVERTFGIRMSRQDFQSVFSAGTVGSLYAYLLYRLDQNEWPRGCVGVPVFYQLRRALVELFGTSEGHITPCRKLDEIIPVRERRLNWRRLRAALDLPLPSLCRPFWMHRLICYGSLGLCLLAILGFFLGNPARDPFWLWFGLLIGGAVKYGAAYILTLPCAVCIPPSCSTVKSLIKTILRSDYGRMAARARMWHEHEVWHALVPILVEALNVKPEQVVIDAHLINDLGAD